VREHPDRLTRPGSLDTPAALAGVSSSMTLRVAVGHAWHDGAMECIYMTPLLDKLGVRPGARVAVLGIDDGDFRALLGGRTHDITDGWPKAASDLVFLAADGPGDLQPLALLRGRIVPAGAVWVVSRKGRAATLRDVEVIEAARAVGLIDNKVVAFSATHTALRLVIPKALRGG
jgi:hypothetical protein